MNEKKLLTSIAILLVLCTGYFRVQATQLSGTYTINATGTATGSTFKNISSAIAYLTGSGSRTDGGPANVAPFGVSGPVVFMIAAGTYSEQVTLKGKIPGASPVNTVTFEGTDAATRTITFGATVSASRHTVKLDSTSYVSFRNLTMIANGATYGWVVHITNSNCNSNKITRCTISVTGVGATSNSGNYCGIVVNGSTTVATTGIGLDSLEIDSNSINSGNYGILSSGLAAYSQKANKIRYNKVYGSYFYGIYTTYQDGVNISDNIVIPRAAIASNSGIAVFNSNSSTTATGNIISRNKVNGFGIYGIRISSVLNSYTGTKGEISNNMIGGGITNAASFPVNIASSNNWNICNNTINHDIAATANVNAAINITGGANLNIFNNIFAETKGGLGLPLYVSTTTAIDSSNYNIFYRSDTSNGQFLFIGGSNYNTGTFRRSGIADSNSVYLKPFFANDTNLHLFNACNKGMALPYIVKDIDGNTRGTLPVIGAHEAQSVPTNIAVEALVTPRHPIDTGLQDLVVRIRNVGTTTVSSFTIAYKLNNGTSVTQGWSGTLAACDTISVVFTAGNRIRLGVANYITVYTNQPNAVTDGNKLDDTISVKYYGILNGTYTIGTSGSDFATMADVRDALQSRGMSGPVTFMLNPGTYTGPFVLNGPIIGSSSVNTLTFEGTNASTRTITAAVASSATVILNQCSNVHFRNITISNTFAGSGTGLAFVGANVNTFGSMSSIKHCRIIMPNLNTASAYGIAVTGSANGYAMSNNRIDSLEIDSNIISGTNTGITIYGNTAASNAFNRNYKIRGNTITNTDGQNDVGMFINYIYNALEVKYNTVNCSGGTGIYFATCGNNFAGNPSHAIISNMIHAGSGGLQLDQCMTASGNPNKIYNNRIFIKSSLFATGIYTSTNGTDEIYHNTIQIDSSSALLLGMAINYDGSNTSKIKNNIFAYSGSGTATIYPVYIVNGVLGDNLNYNVYYNAAGNDLVFRNGIVYGPANFLSDSGGGDSSFNVKPSFTTNNNLHLTTGCPRGVNLTAYVAEDLDAVTRSTSPSIGCYEFGGYANDIQVQDITQPIVPVTVGPKDVIVKLANNGNNPITSFNISYTFNGGLPVTQTWTGFLLACDTISVVFTGANQLSIINGINNLKVYTSGTNGTTDGNKLNDTLAKQFAPALNGNYIIGTAPSDFVNFTSAATALNQRGVSGKVVFDVRTGTYTESFTLTNIIGSSSTNTITFRSMAGHRDSVNITFSGAVASVVTLQATSYTSFRNLSISHLTSGDYYSALFISGAASYDSIENCKLTMPPVTTHATLCLHTNGLTGTGLVVRNNLVTGGYGGIMINILDAFLNPGIIIPNCLVENNTVRNANYASFFFYRATDLTVKNNIVLPDSASTSHYGMQFEHCDSALLVTGNKISGVAIGYGITLNACSGTVGSGGLFSNNQITVGSNADAFGIYVIDSKNQRFYNNSVNILSTATGNNIAGSFSGSTGFDIKNNIFSNMGGGYALTLDGNYKSDYNNLYTTGTNLAKYFTTNYLNLAAWRSSSSNFPDKHSVSYRPGFTSNTNLQPNTADSASWSLNGRGLHLAGNTADIANNPRPSLLAEGVPDIGACEFTPVVAPPLAIPNIVSPVPGDTQIFVSIFAPQDTVATLYWDVFNPSFPSSIKIRQYSGEKPKSIGTAANYMYFYTDIKGVATGFYNYNINLYYKKTWLGTLPVVSDARITKKVTAGLWTVDNNFYSVIDTARGLFSTKFQSDSSTVYSGTDQFAPLPVRLIDLSANRLGIDALVRWTTASETNSSMFEVERSYDGKTFVPAGKIKAAGMSNAMIHYQYLDIDPAVDPQFTNTIYYRLKTIDGDGTSTFSKTVQVTWNETLKDNVTMFPNPFSKDVFARIESQEASEVTVEWMDLTGKILTSNVYKTTNGTTVIDVSTTHALKAGLYFVSVETNGNRHVYKLVKE